MPASFIPIIKPNTIMENNTLNQEHLQQLHNLYYSLAHRVLPDIILSENVDEILQGNPAGDGLLSEVSISNDASAQNNTTHDDYLTEKGDEEAELNNHLREQEENKLEKEDFDFDEEVPDFLLFDEEEQDDENLLPKEDFFNKAPEDDNDLPDSLWDDEDLTEDMTDEDEELNKLLAELEASLELNKGRLESNDPDENFLYDTWREAWYNTTFDYIPNSTGYTLKRLNKGGYEIILFTFPEPLQIADAWMAAAIRQKGESYRYYTLEATIGEAEDEAVLAEWRTGGLHRNSGQRTTDVRNPDAFLEMVFEYLSYDQNF